MASSVQAEVDGALMADAHDLSDGGATLQNQWHAAALGICSNADGQVQLRRLCYLVAAQHRGYGADEAKPRPFLEA